MVRHRREAEHTGASHAGAGRIPLRMSTINSDVWGTSMMLRSMELPDDSDLFVRHFGPSQGEGEGDAGATQRAGGVRGAVMGAGRGFGRAGGRVDGSARHSRALLEGEEEKGGRGTGADRTMLNDFVVAWESLTAREQLLELTQAVEDTQIAAEAGAAGVPVPRPLQLSAPDPSCRMMRS